MKILRFLLFAIVNVVATMFLLRGGLIPRLGISYYCVYAYIFVITILFFKAQKNSTKVNFISFLVIFLPFIFLSIYGLIVNADELYPLIFPVVTVIVLYAIVGAFLVIKKNQLIGSLFFFSGFLLLICWNSFFLKQILLEKENSYTTILKGSTLSTENKILQDPSGLKVSLSTLLYRKKTLMEFMYIDCLPCREKLPFINILNEQYGDYLNVIIIIDGSIESYMRYKKFVESYTEKSTLKFYYDPKGELTKALKIKAFPTEYIVNKNQKIDLVSVGFSAELQSIYVNERKKIIFEN